MHIQNCSLPRSIRSFATSNLVLKHRLFYSHWTWYDPNSWENNCHWLYYFPADASQPNVIQSRGRAAKTPKITLIYNPPTLINSVKPWSFQESTPLKKADQSSPFIRTNRIVHSTSPILPLNILLHSNTSRTRNPEFENPPLPANSFPPVFQPSHHRIEFEVELVKSYWGIWITVHVWQPSLFCLPKTGSACEKILSQNQRGDLFVLELKWTWVDHFKRIVLFSFFPCCCYSFPLIVRFVCK